MLIWNNDYSLALSGRMRPASTELRLASAQCWLAASSFIRCIGASKFSHNSHYVFPFPLNPNQSPRSNSTDWKRHFSRLITVVSVTKAHVSTRFAWRFPDLIVTLDSLEQSKKIWKKNKISIPTIFHISSIHTLYILCNVMWTWPCTRHKNACTIHKHKINTPRTQSGIKYLTYLHPCWKYKSKWIVSDTFPTLTP